MTVQRAAGGIEMSEWNVFNRAVVFPWHCDQYGHMNVRWYSHFFDDGSFLSWSCLGLDARTLGDSGTHTAIVRATIEFKRELLAGTPVTMLGTFSAVGRSSVTMNQRMVDAVSEDVIHATYESVLVFCDDKSRAAVAVPPLFREKLLAAGARDTTGG